MPRATWRGFLRLSLVSCLVYLMPAATKTKSIRLHEVWTPRNERQAEPEVQEDEPPVQGHSGARKAPPLRTEPGPEEADDVGPATRIALRPVARDTGEAIEREEVRKGYEYDSGQFVTFTSEELKAARHRVVTYDRPEHLFAAS
jgi:non-homologous end joining protein Ku